MILCKDCKLRNKVECPRAQFRHDIYKLITETEPDDHCKYAERADGRKACCENCKYYKKFAASYCDKGYYGGMDENEARLDKMLCDEHEFRGKK